MSFHVKAIGDPHESLKGFHIPNYKKDIALQCILYIGMALQNAKLKTGVVFINYISAPYFIDSLLIDGPKKFTLITDIGGNVIISRMHYGEEPWGNIVFQGLFFLLILI